jgi:hypothetical protein
MKSQFDHVDNFILIQKIRSLLDDLKIALPTKANMLHIKNDVDDIEKLAISLIQEEIIDKRQ